MSSLQSTGVVVRELPAICVVQRKFRDVRDGHRPVRPRRGECQKLLRPRIRSLSRTRSWAQPKNGAGRQLSFATRSEDDVLRESDPEKGKQVAFVRI